MTYEIGRLWGQGHRAGAVLLALWWCLLGVGRGLWLVARVAGWVIAGWLVLMGLLLDGFTGRKDRNGESV